MENTKGASKAIAYIVIILLLIGSIGLIFALTNGFTEDFKTFYLECNGEELSRESKRDFRREEVYKFNVKYVLDSGKEEEKDYSVKVVTNAERSFTFKAGKENYAYESGTDITKAFEVIKDKTAFTFKIPQGTTLITILQKLYPDKEITLKNESALSDLYLYSLIVTSYDEKVTYKIDFRLRTQVTGVEFEPKELWF